MNSARAPEVKASDGASSPASIGENTKPSPRERHPISVIVDFADTSEYPLEPRIERFDLKDVIDGIGPSRLMRQAKGNQVNVEPILRWIHIPENDMESIEVRVRSTLKTSLPHSVKMT